MSYLLSSGKLTQDLPTYIDDIFRLHLLIRLKEVPYWDGGSDDLIRSLKEVDVHSSVTNIINNVISTINKKFERTSIRLDSVDITNTNVKINISINGLNRTYDIKRSN